ncbi:motility associated factor glycosyltransferase family protein [Treponema sp.]|uniref:motility associated factor glycosyltransferase family protein n=1 Tax=Treponema sp. TaxID=166 RepID=UPI00388E5D04
MFSLEKESDIPEGLPPDFLAPLEILLSKQGAVTAKDGGKFLHSFYNPLREAEQAAVSAKNSLKDTECHGCAFFSAGLGYTAISYAKHYPEDTIIIIESDPRYFFTALSLVDWSDIFSHKSCIIALGAGIDFVIPLIENTSGLKHTAISENLAQSAHSADYYSALHLLIERNKRKIELNESTLEKFSKLWIRNSCRNLHYLSELDGISVFKDKCPADVPCVVLAAGPTLQEVLPYLDKIKKHAVLICVDTALRAVLKTKVEPDFIVLTDPQYYAYRHIAGLSSPSSILITESAAYPAVFRFNCRKIILISSLFPIGKYIESITGSKGELVAGGSVSTTAWETARFIGAKKIFCAGLDLGFPEFQTHIKGSSFEENIHTFSNRLNTAEVLGSKILFGADIQQAEAYDGTKILTDTKMKMFAWWFESKQEEYKNSVKSYSLSSKSLRIPGFETKTLQEFLEQCEKSKIKEHFLKETKKHSQNSVSKDYYQAVENLKAGLKQLDKIIKSGIETAENGLKSQTPQKSLFELKNIDFQIKNSEFSEILSLVYPTEKILNRLLKTLPPVTDEIKSSLLKSRTVYQELADGIKFYQKYL